MSLNGLDAPAVQDAYQAALAEAGGWFLLKYTSRDSVDLLGRGKGGVHEARAAVAKYEEASPLYGVIVYRRRKVLIKIVPEGTSRVLLARTTVHFQDVVEKYSPYEALLEITSSDALTDTSLAASFPLHTATPSASSNRLDEITEDGEDPAPSQSPAVRGPTSGSYFTPQRHRLAGRMESRIAADRSPSQSIDSTATGARPTSPVKSSGKASVSQFLVRNTSGKPSITSIGSDSLPSMPDTAPSEASVRDTVSSVSTVEPGTATVATSDVAPESSPVAKDGEWTGSETMPATGVPRQSAENNQPPARPSTSSTPTNYDEALLEFLKPKVKLGPRPVAASDKTKRPTTAGVSAMPAPYRFSMRKQEPSRSPTQGSQSPTSPPTRTFPSPPPIPDTPEYNPRPLSRGSIKSMPSHKSTAMTPDKIRLMKAVELRKKQLRKSSPRLEGFVPPDEDTPAVPKVPDSASKTLPGETASPEPPAELPLDTAAPLRDEGAAASYNADSGIEMDYDKADKQDGKRSFEEPVIEERRLEEPAVETIDPPELEAAAAGEAEKPFEAPLAAQSRDVESSLNTSEASVAVFPEDPVKEQSTVDVPSSPVQASPRLAIPGAFSYPASPDVEVAELTLDPNADLPDSDQASEISPREATTAPIVAPKLDTEPVPQIVIPEEPRPATPVRQPKQAEETLPSAASNIGDAAQDDSASSNDDLDVYEMSPKRKNSDLARRRQGFVEPIHIESDAESLSEDELIQELQTATVQEAKPIMVSRSSPVQEFFSRQRPADGSPTTYESLLTPRETRDVYMPSTNSADPYIDSPARAFEAVGERPTTYQPTTATVEKNEPTVGLKRNVSNEISRRIQALAGTSSRDASPVFGSSPRSMSPDLSGGPPLVTRAPSQSRNSPFKPFSRQPSKLNSSANQPATTSPPQLASAPVWTVQRDPVTNRESVSVTARIVRPVTNESTEGQDKADMDAPMSQSPSSQKQNAPSQSPAAPLQRLEINSNSSTPKRESTQLSTASPTQSRTSKDAFRNSIQASQQKALPSPTIDDFPSIPDHRQRSSASAPSPDENVAPKESSRTSRFFKRMSTIGSKRKSGMQQVSDGSNIANAVANLPANPPSKIEVHSLMPPPTVVGDLNIQFPDSLLWKRRIVAIDEAGCIKFSIPQASESKKVPTRRFQLSEFRMPYVPDLDRQELPNSMMLDFIDGTTLQIACEDTITHIQVLHVLKTYWKAWASASAGRSD